MEDELSRSVVLDELSVVEDESEEAVVAEEPAASLTLTGMVAVIAVESPSK